MLPNCLFTEQSNTYIFRNFSSYHIQPLTQEEQQPLDILSIDVVFFSRAKVGVIQLPGLSLLNLSRDQRQISTLQEQQHNDAPLVNIRGNWCRSRWMVDNERM